MTEALVKVAQNVGVLDGELRRGAIRSPLEEMLRREDESS